MRYLPLSDADRREMLERIGLRSVEDLFAGIPAQIRHTAPLDLPSARSESELRSYFRELSAKNLRGRGSYASFMGAGCYEHYVPSVVDALSSRGEFLTAYTPYQPELSQGTLAAIFEFQSMTANLLGVDVVNASMYDGASALAEAVLMALRVRRNADKVVLSRGLHPDYARVVRAYLENSGASVVEADVNEEGRTVHGTPDSKTAAVIVQQPNFFGVIEDIPKLSAAARSVQALLVCATAEAMAFGLLRAPGAEGADIVAGEGQSFGNPPNFGGPHLGLFGCRSEFQRQMPGRLVGRATDAQGRPGYVLTLSTREQHIRREKATSNICTNHSLCALRAAIYLALMGERGIRQVARRNASAAQELRERLMRLPGVTPLYTGPVFNEFAVRLPVSTEAFLAEMEKHGFLAGVPLSRWDPNRLSDLLVAVTETKSAEEIDRFVDAAGKALS